MMNQGAVTTGCESGVKTNFQSETRPDDATEKCLVYNSRCRQNDEYFLISSEFSKTDVDESSIKSSKWRSCL